MKADWLNHSGGPNPAPHQLVDLVWGFGVVERQPSDKVNWSFHWRWRPSAGGVKPSPEQAASAQDSHAQTAEDASGIPPKKANKPMTRERETIARIIELAIMRHGVSEYDLRNTLDDADQILALGPGEGLRPDRCTGTGTEATPQPGSNEPASPLVRPRKGDVVERMHDGRAVRHWPESAKFHCLAYPCGSTTRWFYIPANSHLCPACIFGRERTRALADKEPT